VASIALPIAESLLSFPQAVKLNISANESALLVNNFIDSLLIE
jgi:hypothetical protein